MDPRVIAAFIAVGGVVISAVLSLRLAKSAAGAEIEKTRQTLTSTYAGKLADARLAAYPKLYPLLSDLAKHIEGGSDMHITGEHLTVTDARSLLSKLNAWDSEHALLLSDHASTEIFELRQRLVPIALETAARQLTETELNELLQNAQCLEIALKVDLGVYEVETYEKREFYASYHEASTKVRLLPRTRPTSQSA
jgi:hypothetical protein